jgi:hypothetical protein
LRLTLPYTQLTSHGWQMTGVDFTAYALDKARERARTAGVTVTWLRGDVSALTELGLDPDSICSTTSDASMRSRTRPATGTQQESPPSPRPARRSCVWDSGPGAAARRRAASTSGS